MPFDSQGMPLEYRHGNWGYWNADGDWVVADSVSDANPAPYVAPVSTPVYTPPPVAAVSGPVSTASGWYFDAEGNYWTNIYTGESQYNYYPKPLGVIEPGVQYNPGLQYANLSPYLQSVADGDMFANFWGSPKDQWFWLPVYDTYRAMIAQYFFERAYNPNKFGANIGNVRGAQNYWSTYTLQRQMFECGNSVGLLFVSKQIVDAGEAYKQIAIMQEQQRREDQAAFMGQLLIIVKLAYTIATFDATQLTSIFGAIQDFVSPLTAESTISGAIDVADGIEQAAMAMQAADNAAVAAQQAADALRYATDIEQAAQAMQAADNAAVAAQQAADAIQQAVNIAQNTASVVSQAVDIEQTAQALQAAEAARVAAQQAAEFDALDKMVQQGYDYFSNASAAKQAADAAAAAEQAAYAAQVVSAAEAAANAQIVAAAAAAAAAASVPALVVATGGLTAAEIAAAAKAAAAVVGAAASVVKIISGTPVTTPPIIRTPYVPNTQIDPNTGLPRTVDTGAPFGQSVSAMLPFLLLGGVALVAAKSKGAK